MMKTFGFSAFFTLALVCGLLAAEPVSRRDALSLQSKLDRISRNGESRTKAPARTAISETEVNSYLRFGLADRMPPGVKDPAVTIHDQGKLSGRATVDLERIAKARKSTGLLDPFSYLSGSVPVAVDGTLRTRNGIGTFELASAAISGVPVPAWMLQEIVSYYSKSPASPEGVSLDKPFPLPSGIREIQLARGQAIVVQ